MSLRRSLPDTARREETDAAIAFLDQLVRLRSYSGQEAEAAALALEAFRDVVDETALVPLSDDLKRDPEYSDVLPALRYDGRHNVRLAVRGAGSGPSLILNSHLDVVPESRGQARAFEPYVEENALHARGACDAKGQVACIYLALRLLHRAGRRPAGNVTVHLVVEEENGGNGTLAMIRTADRADACVVLEPTGSTVVPSVRGAVWFRVACEGRAGHSGSHGLAVSALKYAVEAMGLIEGYHADLRARSTGIPLFDAFANPMPLTFGRLEAGNWPAATPDRARLEGVMGFLPNTSRAEVMAGLSQALRTGGSPWLAEHSTMEFMYRHDCHVVAEDHWVVRHATAACERAGLSPKVTAFPASCDSWFYNNLLGIPTVVFGPGSLGVAHAADERIDLRELERAGLALAEMLAP